MEIQIKEIMENLQFVENPELIQIKVIKKKYFEQLPSGTLESESDLAEIEILGQVMESFLIYRKDGKIFRASRSDLVNPLGRQIRATGVIAAIFMNEFFEKLPQIFQD